MEMPTFFKVKDKGGHLRGLQMHGSGENFQEDDNGEGVVSKGNFHNGQLEGIGVKIIYNNNGFTQYSGNFSRGRMHGDFQIIIFHDPSIENMDEVQLDGNGPLSKNGTRFIWLSNKQRKFQVTVKTAQFVNDQKKQTVKKETRDALIYVEQACYDTNIFTKFNVTLV